MKHQTTWLIFFSLVCPLKAFSAVEVAKVGSHSITQEEFNKKYQESLKFYSYRIPSKREVLEDMISRELGIQEARRLGLEKDPVVQDRFNTILYNALLEKKLNSEIERIFITDQEAKTYYTKNPELRTSHIFVGLAPGATPEEVQKSEARLKEVKQKVLSAGKMTFAEAAQKFSEGNAAPMGGDLDYQMKDRLDPTFYETAKRLKVGEVSDIVRTPMGFHLIKLTAIRPWDETDKNRVKRLAFEERRLQVFERYISDLKTKAKVSINSEALK